jgi:hypothetical protein
MHRPHELSIMGKLRSFGHGGGSIGYQEPRPIWSGSLLTRRNPRW